MTADRAAKEKTAALQALNKQFMEVSNKQKAIFEKKKAQLAYVLPTPVCTRAHYHLCSLHA